MPLLIDPQCPQCLSTLSLRPLWRHGLIGSHGKIVLAGRVGVVCPNCGVKLEVRQTRINLVILPFAAAAVAGQFFLFYWVQREHLEPNLGFPAAFAWIGFLYWMLWHNAPRLAQLRTLENGDDVWFPLEWMKADEARYAADLNEMPSIEELQDDSKHEWTCPRCRERGPGSFEICWNCGSSKAAGAASNNRWRGP